MSLSDKPAFVQKLVLGFLESIDTATGLPSFVKYRVVAYEAGAEGGPRRWFVIMTFHKDSECIANLTDFIGKFSNAQVAWGMRCGLCFLDISGLFEGVNVLFSVYSPSGLIGGWCEDGH